MTHMRPFCGFALAVLLLGAGLSTSQTAKAEDLVDFLWGGSDEYGGGRSTVSFDPQYKPGQIIVSFSDRRLYFIDKPGHAITYPVAVPMGEARWQGVTFVSDKKINPAWTPTPDMVRANPRLPRWVPGGHPMNPLGIRAMYLGSSAYRIHGTDAPWTIGQAVSHGCIRMTNEDVLDLYPRVPVGMRVTVTWQQFSTHAVASNEPSYTPSSSSSSGASSYSSNSGYGPYGGGYTGNASNSTGSGEPARKVSRPSDGSIASLFFWEDDHQAPPSPPAGTAASTAAPDEPATAAPASATPSPSSAPKKKTTTASASKKKSEPEGSSIKAVAHATPIVPDPVKPHAFAPADPAPTKASQNTTKPEPTLSATRASASAAEALPVEKVSAQVQ